MKKVALVFLLAVFVPSLVLAWLAVRTLRDQQFLLEKQQSLLYQGVADSAAKNVQDLLSDDERVFTEKVAALLQRTNPAALAKTFDDNLRGDWPLAQVGFAVTLTGDILSPSPYSRSDALTFCTDNSRFLANRESVEVYLNPKQIGNSLALNAPAQSQMPQQTELKDANSESSKRTAQLKGGNRAVYPQQSVGNYNNIQKFSQVEEQQQQNTFSKVAASEAEFRQLIGEANDGTLARFVDNKLNVLFWYRARRDSPLVFGAQIALPKLIEELRPMIEQVETALHEEICVALLDDTARPVAKSHSEFRGNWKHPFVATEIGEALPHWEVAVYLLDPAKLTRSAQSVRLTLGLLIALLVTAIAVGSWLIVMDLNRQLTLARQKTDFVSNVSHELKTPLTSIRMFSELLSEGRVEDVAKQRSYLAIIAAETARLTRLINNVLDFARLERGEKKYVFKECDIVAIAHETAETYRPHLEANGFQFDCDLPGSPIMINADRDAIAQVLVNLLSNAEKYSDPRKEISLQLARQSTPLPHVEARVLDRGLGVPANCGEKIFEKFFRAHDSLSSGIQGSGLGLTLARQIARAHGGEVIYEPRNGGGSCFILRLPLKTA